MGFWLLPGYPWLRSALVVGAIGIGVAVGSPAAAATSLELYEQGDIAGARSTFAQELAQAEAGGDRASLWQQRMFGGWLEESLGNPRRSLEHSNAALAVALALSDEFRVGRSLAWLGWSYASLGLYELSLAFFDRAIEVGAPGDEIRHVAVWGLATQEKGWVLARLGRLAEGRRLLERTTDFARRNGIDTGVAEGGAHLAEIALLEGRLGSAEQLAGEALRAAERCACRPANTARAWVVVARAALARAALDARFAGEAREKAQSAVAFAERIGDQRDLAEARLLLARSLPEADVERRLTLARDALNALDASGADLRGRARTELARVLADSGDRELARLYLEAGLEISQRLFRSIDAAYQLSDLAELDFADAQLAQELERRVKAARDARRLGLLPLALDNESALGAALQQEGRPALAREWIERALATLDEVAQDADDEAQRLALASREAELRARLAQVRLALSGPPDAGAP